MVADVISYDTLLKRDRFASDGGFTKHDTNKPDWTLIPFDGLEGAVRVFEHGAKKYSRNNWRKCDDPRRYLAAAMRHLTALIAADTQGDKTAMRLPDESGELHLDHAIASLVLLRALLAREEHRE